MDKGMESKMQKLDLDMEEEGGLSTWQKVVGALVIGLLLGAGGYVIFGGKKEPTKETTGSQVSEESTESDTSADSETTMDSSKGETVSGSGSTMTNPAETSSSVGASADVVVAENQTAGDSVLVKLASLAQDGWIVVHEDRAGKPGNVLGATYRAAGLYNNVSVHLLRGTSAGGTYYVMIHKDDGNKDDFSLQTDSAVMTGAGEPVMIAFKTQ